MSPWTIVCATSKAVCEVWHEHLSARSCEAGHSPTTSSHQARRLCCSLSLTVPMPPVNAFHPRSDSPKIWECLGWGCVKQLPHSLRRTQSRLWRKAGRGNRPDTGSHCRPIYGQLCNPYLGTVMGNYCARIGSVVMGNSVATKVITTYVSRSTGLSYLDVARPTHRPKRPHPSSLLTKTPIHTIGRLAARCPSGEEAQRDLTLRARKRAAPSVPAWLRSCRLPAAPADYSGVSGSGLYLLAVGTRDKRDVWGLSAQPKVRARGGAFAPLRPSAHKTLPAVIYLPPRF